MFDDNFKWKQKAKCRLLQLEDGGWAHPPDPLLTLSQGNAMSRATQHWTIQGGLGHHGLPAQLKKVLECLLEAHFLRGMRPLLDVKRGSPDAPSQGFCSIWVLLM